MKYGFASLGLALWLALAGAPAGAEKADRGKPMNIEADALRYDDLKQMSVFTGKVVVTKGSIMIRGARIEVRQDAEGYQHGVVTAEQGRRAFFRQKREGVEEYIEGEAETIEYDGKLDRVRFLKQAEMRRYRGTSVTDEVAGELITYDNANDVFSVDGGPASPAAGGRVRAVLSPKPASAPAAGQPQGALRPSQTMEGGTK